MRIVTWNCFCGPFAAKVNALHAFEADLLVLQQRSEPQVIEPNTVWVGRPGQLGVAVVARSPYEIKLLPALNAPDFFVPVQVSGPVSFVLVGVWTVSSTKYIRGLVTGLRALPRVLRDQAVVVAGDFNSNLV
jgi:hypothetical protein